ncbi:MAG: Crp/Fnr family transcriptional regulator [Cytophagales bacterium]|nr:Crp/Fnr family transcriptional regulator [Cytophagales bacterium]
MYERLNQLIREKIRVTDEELNLVLSLFRPLTVPRNKWLLEKGSVADHLYFIVRGCLRLYYTQADGSEATRFMAFEDTFLTSMVSFIYRQPAAEYIETVEPATLLTISWRDFCSLRERIPAWEKFYIYLLEYGILVNTNRLNSILTLNATERYRQLLKENPDLVQRLSNGNLAAYLNISPETLSRLKSHI